MFNLRLKRFQLFSRISCISSYTLDNITEVSLMIKVQKYITLVYLSVEVFSTVVVIVDTEISKQILQI